MDTSEIQLLLCCARPDIDAATAARIRSLVAGKLDWTRLIEPALGHGVTSLLYRALTDVCADAVPVELLEALAHHDRSNRTRVQHLADELSGIVDDCRRRDVRVVPFKGPTLSALAYGDMGLRRPGDLDLMVREDDLPAVHEVLTARGYVRTDGPERPLPDHLEAAYRKYQCEQMFVRQEDSILVEPQWAIGARTLAYSIDYDAMWTRARSVPFNGTEMPGFAAEDLMILLCAHGTKHYWSELRWVADIAALVARRPAIDLEACLADARRQGCERMVLLGLALAERLLGADLPSALHQRVDANPACRSLVRETVDGLFEHGGERPGPFTVTAYQLRARERLRDRLVFAARCIFTPRLMHFSLVRLPPALSFLYCPIKLVHDYVLLPAWLAFKFFRSPRSAGKQSPRISATASGSDDTVRS